MNYSNESIFLNPEKIRVEYVFYPTRLFKKKIDGYLVSYHYDDLNYTISSFFSKKDYDRKNGIDGLISLFMTENESRFPSRLAQAIASSLKENESEWNVHDRGEGNIITDMKTDTTFQVIATRSRFRINYKLESPVGLSDIDQQVLGKLLYETIREYRDSAVVRLKKTSIQRLEKKYLGEESD